MEKHNEIGRANTHISYLYRDACNYKVHNEAIIRGELSAQQIDVIMGCLNDGEYFIISYLYRDACNYKVHNEAIIRGELSAQQIDVIMGCLNDGEYFIPSQVELPEERFGSFTEDDHCWFELTRGGFSSVKEDATVDISADELVKRFMKAKNNWHDDEIMQKENVENYADIYVYIPDKKKIIYISEGTGDNLLREDIAEGYVDYINYTIYDLDNGKGYVDYINYTIYDLDNGIEESDGGMIMLKELFQRKYLCAKDCIPDVLEFVELENKEFLVL